MPSPYSTSEISQAGDPAMGQVGAQNANVNDNLYASSYPTAPGRAADTGTAGGGSDLASQGLMKLQGGDQYGGIMTLLDAAQQNPQSVQNPAFLQQLQIVESQPAAATSSGTDASQFNAPTDSPAYGATSDTTAASSPSATGQGGDANALATQALQVAQSNPTEGILGLMQAATVNPDLMNDQNFLTTMSEVLPQGPGAAAAQTSADGAQVQQPTDGSQQQVPMDGSQQQVQQPVDASQPQIQQPVDASQPQVQQPVDASQPQVQQPADASQPQVQQPVDASQYQQPVDSSQQPTAAQAYTMPAQLTSSGDPNIEAGVKQAFQLIQSGDQFDGARLLMMIAKADPAILQDQAFIKNLTDLETAVQSGAATSSDQTASQQQQQYDANGNPIDAQGNPIPTTDAQGNPIAQPGAQTMTDANGNPIAQPGAQVMTDANGNPVAQPGAQIMTDANGNPIAQPGTQQVMTDAQGNPISQPGTQQVMTDAQGNPVSQPTDTQAQTPVSMDPSTAAY